LVPSRPETLDLALRFLTEAQRHDHLFILGDLFEYWLGDDAGIPAYTSVIDALYALQTHNCQLTVMLGNRDFLLGKQFAERAHANLITEDEHIISLGDNRLGDSRTLIMHGDTLCTDDTAYQQFRHKVRDSQWQSEFLSMSLDQRIETAESYRDASREANSQKSSSIMDVNDAAVAERIESTGCKTLIHGHTHRPAIHEMNDNTTRYVLGDWKIDHAQYVHWTQDSIQLKTFN